MSEVEMKVDPARAQHLVSQLRSVNERIVAVAKGRPVRLVAVSKLKPANDILALHEGEENHVHFGENYANELTKKAEILPKTIKWHFIGGLQSGHCKPLARIPNLWCVSSVDSLKKAQLLDRYRGERITARASPSSPSSPSPSAIQKLNIHVQVNTSGESTKSGCSPGEETISLCRSIERECPNLHLLGLMTIGAIARSAATGTGEDAENEDFRLLREQRDLVARELGIVDRELELSMGMSGDFEGAIVMGSSEVRVGSTIFGERPAKGDATIVA